MSPEWIAEWKRLMTAYAIKQAEGREAALAWLKEKERD